MTGTNPFLKVNLCAGYGEKNTLQGISFSVKRGERVGIVGGSGAGKSTLVLALLGLLRFRGGWTSGTLELNHCDLLNSSEAILRKMRGREIALVPQSPLTSLNPALSLQTHFREAWLAHQSRSQTSMDLRVKELLRRVQLPSDISFLKRRPAEVSIGQAQRALIALALLHRPSLLLADEPTSALDACTQEEVLQLFEDVNRSGETTLLYVSHDLVSVFRLCDRMLVMDRGALVDDVCLKSTTIRASHPATIALLRTLPVAAEVLTRNRLRNTQEAQTSVDQPGLRKPLLACASVNGTADELSLRSSADGLCFDTVAAHLNPVVSR